MTQRRWPRANPKKLPETDAIFAQVKQINEEVDANEQTLWVSMDAKATVKVGPFARGGKVSWPPKPPITIFTQQPRSHQWEISSQPPMSFSFDCLADRLIDWWETARVRFPHIKTFLINLDTGPENHSWRTQFMQRLLEFVERYQITVRLAYYPPYHSK